MYMENKFITKGEITKIIKESGLVPYNDIDNSEQYADNESFTKLLYTTLTDVEWFSNKIPEDNHTFFEGKVNVDWGIKFDFTSSSFKYEPFIKSVKGILRVYRYNAAGQKEKKDYQFDSKGYKMELDAEMLTKNGVLGFTAVIIDTDTKVIEFSNYGNNYESNYEWED